MRPSIFPNLPTEGRIDYRVEPKFESLSDAAQESTGFSARGRFEEARTTLLRTRCVPVPGSGVWHAARKSCRLERADVFRLPAFGPFGHVKLYRLAFLQALEAIRLDGRKMDEHILAGLTADEAVALG